MSELIFGKETEQINLLSSLIYIFIFKFMVTSSFSMKNLNTFVRSQS